MPWHVAYVEPQAEHRVARDTASLGFQAYLPVERLWLHRRGVRQRVSRPLFPRYLFVAVTPPLHWQGILAVDGVVNLLGRPPIAQNDQAPTPVAPGAIAAIRKAEACGVFDRTATEPENFRIGEWVRISDGPFSGFHAKIQQFITRRKRARTAEKKARIAMEFMRQITEVELALTQLEKLPEPTTN